MMIELQEYGKGAVNELKKSTKHAVRCSCSKHILNTSITSPSKLISCHNASGTMRKVITFANASPKRHDVFKKELGPEGQ
ncbi:unnamed protein product [Diabrotica balteata]|uniref:Uncharacterized protein n=1 Tax=Diabrotica balteata TaxID=107213 RepID=A0A9N9SWC0_DIABA|nr:unnamed protein product [Diabrotica balteata]